ncbi:nucleotidyltransferase family protein [Candidatus Gottesmanbacteria bacterium]|nr:nucleotidyltransferase family protein [Candidatus Gottesmanbacteria bacterium]
MDIQTIQHKTTSLFKQYGVKRASLFGSTARGEHTSDSDVDILVEMAEKSRLFDFLALQTDLEQTLGRKVDLVEYEAIRPRLKPYILNDTKDLYIQP